MRIGWRWRTRFARSRGGSQIAKRDALDDRRRGLRSLIPFPLRLEALAGIFGVVGGDVANDVAVEVEAGCAFNAIVQIPASAAVTDEREPKFAR
jgi:hypothetical protein